jgi:hypothetical protein
VELEGDKFILMSEQEMNAFDFIDFSKILKI